MKGRGRKIDKYLKYHKARGYYYGEQELSQGNHNSVEDETRQPQQHKIIIVTRA